MLATKRAFNMKQKNIFIIFQGLSGVRNGLRPKIGHLNTILAISTLRKYQKAVILSEIPFTKCSGYWFIVTCAHSRCNLELIFSCYWSLFWSLYIFSSMAFCVRLLDIVKTYLVVSSLGSETRGSGFESSRKLCSVVSSLQ